MSTADLHALVEDLLIAQSPVDDTDLVDQLEALERVKATACAVQARLADELAQQRPTSRGHPAASVATEVALARRESPHAGRRKLRLATALLHDLPHTYLALCGGDLSERRAQIIADETACLSHQDRLAADAQLDATLFTGAHGCALGDKRLTHKIRGIVHALDDEAATARHDKAMTNRHLRGCLRRDGTAEITLITDPAQYTAIMGSLDKHATTIHAAGGERTGDDRTRSQVIADAAAARLAGTPEPHDQTTPVAVQLVVSAETLLGGHSHPARIPGHGPIPATIARRMVTSSDPERSTLRRLFAQPRDGALVAMESAQRRFPSALRDLLILRDDICRTPWCNAPIRHADHPIPHARGGATTARNGQGLCAGCNYVKDHTGWRHRPGPTSTTHHIDTTTPTGHQHRSREPGAPIPDDTTRIDHTVRADIMIGDHIDYQLMA